MLDFPVLVLKLIKYSSIDKSESIVGVLNEIPMLAIGFTSAGSWYLGTKDFPLLVF